MNSIRQITRLNDVELSKCTPPNASWHTDYRDTAYIHIGGLPFDLSEGDVLTIFSQYGNPTDIKLIRDKDTGKSRGFGFLKYEDQPSCDLAVDNLSGASVLGRVLGVDHARYSMQEGERETVGDDDGEVGDGEDERRRKKRRTESESSAEESRPMIKEEVELAKLMKEHDDDDPMKAYLVKEKKAEIEEALKAVAISKPKKKSREKDDVQDNERKHRHRHHHHHRSRRDKDDSEARNDHRPRRREKSEDEDKADPRNHGSRGHRSSGRKRSFSRSISPSFSRSVSPTDSEDERNRRKRRSHRPEPESEDTRRRRRKDDD